MGGCDPQSQPHTSAHPSLTPSTPTRWAAGQVNGGMPPSYEKSQPFGRYRPKGCKFPEQEFSFASWYWYTTVGETPPLTLHTDCLEGYCCKSGCTQSCSTGFRDEFKCLILSCRHLFAQELCPFLLRQTSTHLYFFILFGRTVCMHACVCMYLLHTFIP